MVRLTADRIQSDATSIVRPVQGAWVILAIKRLLHESAGPAMA
jgi:hypothetical protein